MTIRDLYEDLRHDDWRTNHEFSADIKTVNETLFHPYANDSDRIEQLNNWLQKYQSCLFGRIAAAKSRLHFSVLTEKDILQRSDSEIAGIIHRDLLDWKRRSIQPESQRGEPAHGFVLIVCSSKLALAAPDANLRAFAMKLLDLWGCPQTQEPQGTMHWETLYLRDPGDYKHCVRFTFSVDFFASAGDKRWWHDHRCPGGILFTANSVGHMRKYREWYEHKEKQEEWVVKTAMLTIAAAADVPEHGKAMWLRDVGGNGEPFLPNVACPYSKEGLKAELQGKDWTRYGGFVHSDHAVRPEFFKSQGSKAAGDVLAQEYLEDFCYLYDGKSRDYSRFIRGDIVSEEDVDAALGRAETWTTVRQATSRKMSSKSDVAIKSVQQRGIAAMKGSRADGEAESERDRQELDALLAEGRGWELSGPDLDALT